MGWMDSWKLSAMLAAIAENLRLRRMECNGENLKESEVRMLYRAVEQRTLPGLHGESVLFRL